MSPWSRLHFALSLRLISIAFMFDTLMFDTSEKVDDLNDLDMHDSLTSKLDDSLRAVKVRRSVAFERFRLLDWL